MEKFDNHFKEKLENMQVAPPSDMWDRIQSDLNKENKKTSTKVFSLNEGWAWKFAAAAALVISVISITLLLTQNNSNPVVSEQGTSNQSDLTAFGNDYEEPFFSSDKADVAFGRTDAEEAIENDAILAEEEVEDPAEINTPVYSMKILPEESGEGTEYYIVGPEGSIPAEEMDSELLMLTIEISAINIAESTREALMK